ncbi:MAG: glucose-1-phosphate cytidylyltransferase [Elusimicrobiales bacterium]|nr:glucose-1-phosphate cytidylyltransferase [Elusimicrobiales bacterium]
MKTVILAGGLGTRLGEETGLRPKPMVEIGGRPILWHIMKLYSAAGFNDFIICLGYKGYVIKEYFANYLLHNSDVTFDLRENKIEMRAANVEPWRVTLADTGADALTGTRIKRIEKYLDDGPFMLTYGDGVADVDLRALAEFHKKSGKIATVTAVQQPGRFGAMELKSDGAVKSFREKPHGEDSWINGGFFVLERRALDFIGETDVLWEHEPLNSLVAKGELCAYRHNGFWQPMDTPRDKNYLDGLCRSGNAPWMKP